jgi:hypothetical protein
MVDQAPVQGAGNSLTSNSEKGITRFWPKQWSAALHMLRGGARQHKSDPVGGAVVYVRAPKPVWVEGFPGMPANATLGRPKLAWLNTLKNWPSIRSLTRSLMLAVWRVTTAMFQ